MKFKPHPPSSAVKLSNKIFINIILKFNNSAKPRKEGHGETERNGLINARSQTPFSQRKPPLHAHLHHQSFSFISMSLSWKVFSVLSIQYGHADNER